jgi:hypothetical protein
MSAPSIFILDTEELDIICAFYILTLNGMSHYEVLFLSDGKEVASPSARKLDTPTRFGKNYLFRLLREPLL